MIALLQARMPHRMPKPRTPQSNKRAAMKSSLRRLDEKVAGTYALRGTIVASRFAARSRCQATRAYVIGQKEELAAFTTNPKTHNAITEIATSTITVTAVHFVSTKCQ